ncbi:MAG TPA: hypothetical protein VN634_15775 [Candidatus Limnocylindrales bacterium]|nr:hypothetical protein [Candidatus Limnocylindrales bacterium]
MIRPRQILLPLLVAVALAAASPVSATDDAAPAAATAKQAKYLLHVDGMT